MTMLAAKKALGLTSRTPVEDARKEWKRQIVHARIIGDEEKQRALSQVNQALKKVRHCVDCGVILGHSSTKNYLRCRMHENIFRHYSRSFGA